MIINFGYVAISMKLKDASPNKTVTLKNLEKMDRSLWEQKLESIGRLNIKNSIRVIRYNSAYGIKLYRLTSKIIPFATHAEFANWNWKNVLREEFEELGQCVKETNMRISTHPDHFTILNSPRQEVVKAAVRDLDYHSSMFELMGLGDEYKMNIHIGGMYKNKEDSIKRFYEGFLALEDRIKRRIILENDDKIYNAEEVLNICNDLGIPMTLDIHHDMCNPSKHKIKDLIKDIFETWKNQKYPPKIHVSSPKSEKEKRNHHDYVDAAKMADFLEDIKDRVDSFDAMVEAKMKDEAVFKLVDELNKYKFIKRLGGATIEIDNLKYGRGED